jgi:hypothetical protein
MTDAEVATLGGDIVHPAVGISVLVIVAVLNIFKPRGQTGLGQRKAPIRRADLRPLHPHPGCASFYRARSIEWFDAPLDSSTLSRWKYSSSSISPRA